MDDQRTDREGSRGVRPRGYPLQRLIVGVTLISIGLAMVVLTLEYPAPLDWWLLLRLLLILVGGALIGAGVMTLFKHPLIGALAGFVLAGAALVVLAIVNVIVLFMHAHS
jgi:peptidoglycan/LPS O-acetylase OafA/YrhL